MGFLGWVFWAGWAYWFRREDTVEVGGTERRFLSVEASDVYPTLKPGFYTVVAGACGTRTEALWRVAAIRKYVPGAYVHRTRIYMECRD